MHSEYAVDPEAIGSSWETFRYVIEKFGFDRGRLISQFPKKWFREVYKATEDLSPIEKKRIELALNQAKKNKIVKYNRTFSAEVGEWINNALDEHQRSPFRAIIANEIPDGHDFIISCNDLDESHPLMTVNHDRVVPRDAISIASALQTMLRFGSQILFVDPYFDPYDSRYKSTLRECLKIVKAGNPNASCEIHYRFHENKPAQEELERESVALFADVIPEGMKIKVFCWKEKEGGADFHARYLITELGGVGVDAGFSAEGDHQTTDMHLMSYEMANSKANSFSRESADYELIEPILEIAANGHVRHV